MSAVHDEMSLANVDNEEDDIQRIVQFWYIEYYCYMVCKGFVKANGDAEDNEHLKSSISTVKNIFGFLIKKDIKIIFTQLKPWILLTEFCSRLLKREFEDQHESFSESIDGYIPFLFSEYLSNDPRMNHMVKALNSQKIIRLAEKNEKRNAFKLLRDLQRQDALLYATDMKSIIQWPHKKPDYLKYASFLLEMKQLIVAILEILEQPFLRAICKVFRQFEVAMDTTEFMINLSQFLEKNFARRGDLEEGDNFNGEKTETMLCEENISAVDKNNVSNNPAENIEKRNSKGSDIVEVCSPEKEREHQREEAQCESKEPNTPKENVHENDNDENDNDENDLVIDKEKTETCIDADVDFDDENHKDNEHDKTQEFNSPAFLVMESVQTTLEQDSFTYFDFGKNKVWHSKDSEGGMEIEEAVIYNDNLVDKEEILHSASQQITFNADCLEVKSYCKPMLQEDIDNLVRKSVKTDANLAARNVSRLPDKELNTKYPRHSTPEKSHADSDKNLISNKSHSLMRERKNTSNLDYELLINDHYVYEKRKESQIRTDVNEDVVKQKNEVKSVCKESTTKKPTEKEADYENCSTTMDVDNNGIESDNGGSENNKKDDDDHDDDGHKYNFCRERRKRRRNLLNNNKSNDQENNEEREPGDIRSNKKGMSTQVNSREKNKEEIKSPPSNRQSKDKKVVSSGSIYRDYNFRKQQSAKSNTSSSVEKIIGLQKDTNENKIDGKENNKYGNDDSAEEDGKDRHETSSETNGRRQRNRLHQSVFQRSSTHSFRQSPNRSGESITWTSDEDSESRNLPPPNTSKRRPYTMDEVDWLRQGVRRFGRGSWVAILNHYPFEGRTAVNLKDKWRNLVKHAATG